jgi:hypothetical protein
VGGVELCFIVVFGYHHIFIESTSEIFEILKF